ncbi:MAG: type II toxin-antitoxin system HicB family antitoxin [Deltaproteobacteria bacterium]|nr:type II toxin-antitoxin system HicB family antitoxin [Deltaproteobacteria bacterium]
MKNTLKYKGHTGTVVFDADDHIFHGRLMGLTDIITFEGASVSELEKDFRSAVDEYLKTCKEINRLPEKPFSGRFMLRVPSELHCAIALAAKREGKSINAWIAEVCQQNAIA